MKVTAAKMDAVMAGIRRYTIKEEIAISIYRKNGFGERDKPSVFGVNWGALGTVSPQDAKRFADELKRFAKIVEKLNDLEIKVDYDGEDELIDCKDRYEAAVEYIVRGFEKDMAELYINRLIRGRVDKELGNCIMIQGI